MPSDNPIIFLYGSLTLPADKQHLKVEGIEQYLQDVLNQTIPGHIRFSLNHISNNEADIWHDTCLYPKGHDQIRFAFAIEKLDQRKFQLISYTYICHLYGSDNKNIVLAKPIPIKSDTGFWPGSKELAAAISRADTWTNTAKDKQKSPPSSLWQPIPATAASPLPAVEKLQKTPSLTKI